MKLNSIEDIEILRFFDLNIKIKMVKLNSNSVAVDEIKDVKKAEKILKKGMQELPDNDFILVIGAKPEFKIPDINFQYIYAANGAIERVKNFKNSDTNFELISVVGGLEFEKNDEVKRRVLDSNLNEMICRLGKIDTHKYKKLNEVKFQ